jgi:Uma2 family endonuclease
MSKPQWEKVYSKSESSSSASAWQGYLKIPAGPGRCRVARDSKSQDNPTMATQPLADALISVEEYLNSDYEPDCEYNGGVLEERNVGEFDHSFLQTMLATLFTNRIDDWRVFALTEQRVQLNPRRYLIPDVTVLRMGFRREPIVSQPPLIAVEILSPKDTLKAAAQKALEYLDFGVEHVWIVDPGPRRRRAVYRGTRTGLELVPSQQMTVPETPISVNMDEFFTKLDGF